MGRINELLSKTRASDQAKVDADVESGVVEVMDFRPDNIPQEVWDLIQENGQLATQRLHEILSGPRFHRLRAGDQAKLIALAQNRAYGLPKSDRSDTGKRKAGATDVTQAELNNLASRAALPEYRRVQTDVEDAEVINVKK